MMETRTSAADKHMNTCTYPLRNNGVVTVIVCVFLALLFAAFALAVDLGHLHVVHAELQTVADAAALAGASGLAVDQDEAQQRAQIYAKKNYANGAPVTLLQNDVQFGLWDRAAQVFSPAQETASTRPNAIKVFPKLTKQRASAVTLFFARTLGFDSADLDASAIAVFGSRDIVLTLDYSASMNDDSELAAIPRLGQLPIEQTLWQIYLDLGRPSYGNMTFETHYIPSTQDNIIQDNLALTNVPYPYPSGSWPEYFQYVQTDTAVRNAGYRQHYGFLTLIDYWQTQQCGAHQTPDLWKTTEQPITAVKDAVAVFLSYMNQQRTDDRLALVAYTSSLGQAVLEVPLTEDYALIETTSRKRQAGHYHQYTNIAAGIKSARRELLEHGRTGALQLIVLLSDGIPNWFDNSYDIYHGRQDASQQARLAARDNIPILTISLGSNADLQLMQELADITGGIHFVVPGGQSVNNYELQLMDIFAIIAAHRPLGLVQ